jgi:hypothetical protein
MTHPDPTPREPQADQASTRYVPPQRLTPGGPVHGGFTVTEHDTSGVPETTPLGLHLLSEHRLANAHLLTPDEQLEAHNDEHAGPGTIRNHPPAARDWSPTKVRETLDWPEGTKIRGTSRKADSWPPGWTAALLERLHRAVAFEQRGDAIILDTTMGGRLRSCVECWPNPCDHPADPKAHLETLTPSLPARLVREFHEAFNLPINDTRYTTNLFRAKLVLEEAREAADAITAPLAFTDGGRADVAKELADAVITLYGTAVTMGIDLDEAVRLVHASNMTKSGVDSDGKVTKGPNYVEPDMSPAVLPLPDSSKEASS